MARQRTGDGQTDSRAVRILVELYEFVEDVLGLFWRNTDTRILDHEEHLFANHADAHRDVCRTGCCPPVFKCRRIGELDGVVEQHSHSLDSRHFVGNELE